MNTQKIEKLLLDNAPKIIGFSACTAIVGGSILSANAGAYIQRKKDRLQYDLMDKKDKAEFIFKTALPKALPAVLTTAAAVGLTASAVIIGERKVAALGAVLAGTETIFKAEQKTKLKKNEGKDFVDILAEDESLSGKEVVNTGTGDTLFFEPYTHQFFTASMEFVKDCEYNLNRHYILRSYTTLSEFLEFLGLRTSKYSDSVGWSDISEGVYGYRWVDFIHQKRTTEGGIEYYSIEYPFAPHYDYDDPYHDEEMAARR